MIGQQGEYATSITFVKMHRTNLGTQACQLHYPFYIKVESPDLAPGATRELSTAVSKILSSEIGAPGFEFRVTPDAVSTDHETSLTVVVKADKKAPSTSSSLRSWAPVLDICHNPARSVDSATLAPFIATEIRKVFENDKDSITYLLRDSPFASEVLGALSPETRLALDAKATRAFKYAPTYHLTFSLFTTSASPSAWNIEQAIKDSIAPLLDRLSSISKFTIDSQVQLYASFSPSIAGPQYDSSTREWKLQRSDLSGFVNAAEWPLNPSIGSGPTINFVLFVPSKEQSPLVLAKTGGNSWVIPQWGGVQILNPSRKQTEVLTAEDLQPVMLTFADQLTSLLGLPQSPPSLALRIAALTRERATSLILSASSTLGALSRLTLKLTSIAIPDTVAKSVDETIHRLTEACHDIKEGRYEKALTNARIAEGEAEHAFFEPSMVGQVYFPEEHKVAVYVPLLGPMAVPLVMAAIKELKKLREKKAKTA
jgi:phosphatidylinositol glycan class S